MLPNLLSLDHCKISCVVRTVLVQISNNLRTISNMGDRDLSEDEVADLKEAFAMFDINGDGAYPCCEDARYLRVTFWE